MSLITMTQSSVAAAATAVPMDMTTPRMRGSDVGRTGQFRRGRMTRCPALIQRQAPANIKHDKTSGRIQVALTRAVAATVGMMPCTRPPRYNHWLLPTVRHCKTDMQKER